MNNESKILDCSNNKSLIQADFRKPTTPFSPNISILIEQSDESAIKLQRITLYTYLQGGQKIIFTIFFVNMMMVNNN